MSKPMAEQEFVDLLSPKYRGLDSDGESESDFSEAEMATPTPGAVYLDGCMEAGEEE